MPLDHVSAVARESPLLGEFGTDAFTVTAHHGMRIAGRRMQGSDCENFIADISAVPRRLVVGSGAAQWLAAQGIVCPSRLQDWALLGEDGLIVQLHIDQYLLVDQVVGGAAPALFDGPLGRASADRLVLSHDLTEIALGGPARAVALDELCAVEPDYDCDNWLSVRLAHCEVGLWHRIAPVPHTRIQCTAADARYLFGVLRECLQSMQGKVIGFDDFLQLCT
jgi:sarcosine oxidase, subunit gamma